MHWTLPELLALPCDDYAVLLAWVNDHRRPMIDEYADTDA